jgi:hypothetical protein
MRLRSACSGFAFSVVLAFSAPSLADGGTDCEQCGDLAKAIWGEEHS